MTGDDVRRVGGRCALQEDAVALIRYGCDLLARRYETAVLTDGFERSQDLVFGAPKARTTKDLLVLGENRCARVEFKVRIE